MKHIYHNFENPITKISDNELQEFAQTRNIHSITTPSLHPFSSNATDKKSVEEWSLKNNKLMVRRLYLP